MIKINEEDNINLSKLCACKKDDIMLLWFLEGNPSCVACAVSLILECLESGIYPAWAAANRLH